MNSVENYALLIDKINIFIRKYYFNNLLRGFIFLGAGLFSAYIVIALFEYFGNFNPFLRTLLFYFFILLNTGLISWLIVPSVLAWYKLGKSLSHDEAAEIIGKHFNTINDKLVNTLQLKKLADGNERHRALIEASINQKIESLNPVSFPSAINIKENSKYLVWILLPVTLIFVIAFAAPSVLTESTKRLIRHNEYFIPAAPFNFIIQNKTLSVVQGDDLKLDVKLKGDKFPADVYVETAGNTFKLNKENISHFTCIFSNLQQNTRFKLIANGFTSAPYEIKVNLRPALLHFDVKLNYPFYLHKSSEYLANAGDLTIPAGTVVKWFFHTQNASGLLFNLDGRTVNISTPLRGVFEHSERIIKNSRFKIIPLNEKVTLHDSSTYRINAIVDESPSITVNEKQDSVSMKAIYFEGRIQDDHGFASLNFHYRVGMPGDKSIWKSFIKPIKADLDQTQANFFFFWNLKDLAIKQGDQVFYYFEVADNDGVSGPKKVRTPERSLIVPDITQLNNELNAGTQAIKQKMQSSIKLAGQIEHDSQKLKQLLLNKSRLSFDEKKQVGDLLQKRLELDALVKEIQNDNRKNLYNRRENQPLDIQLAEKQQQMEQLLNNVIDPKTQQMLQKLQDLLQKDQKDNTSEELSKMQIDNKSLKKELDRMLELYKKLEFEQKLNENVNRLNELSQEQQQLATQAMQPGTKQQKIQKDQQKQTEEFKDVKKSLDELQKTNELSEHKQSFENPKNEEQSIEQQMNKSTDELNKNNQAKASKSQQQTAKEMKQLADKMDKKEQEGEESENSVDAQQLRGLLKNLINSSFQQETIMQTLKTTNPTDPDYVSLAQSQKNIKDNLKTAEDSLYALSRRIPQIQSTVNKEITGINTYTEQALENLGERRTAEATRSQQYAMTSMNNLALMLSEALDQVQNMKKKGESGKGKGKKSVSQLAKMQQQLNQNMQKTREQMQQMGNEGKSKSGNGNNGNISEQLVKLARQQQMIRQALEQLNREDNKDGKGGLGDLDKISKEMEQTEHDLVNRKISEEALKRQQQIHSRLLVAEKAEQEREQDQQRESHAGSNTPPGYIKALHEYQQSKEKQTEQVRTVPTALNLFYKSKIKSYFDLLNSK